MNRMTRLNKKFIDLVNLLQQKIVLLYLTVEDLSSYILTKNKKDTNISEKVIFTVFSRASNYDIEK
jgi:hypothetical protein